MKKPNFTKAWLTGFTSNLAGVMIGIVLTFGITFLFQHGQRQTQGRHLLSMVAQELAVNVEQVKSEKEKLLSEVASAQALYPYVDNPQAIPIDTLAKHVNFLFSLIVYDSTVSSLEVFKNSSQTGGLSNQELLGDIFAVYEEIADFHFSVNELTTSRKDKGIDYFTEHVDYRLLRPSLSSDEVRELFAYVMENDVILRNYVTSMANYKYEDLSTRADELVSEVGAVIEKINEEIE